jgi:hypothetical protein
VFTQNSIGIALCNRYKLSKGKSLTAYVNEGNEDSVIKLLSDLLEHYELHYQSEIDGSEATSLWGVPNKQYKTYYQKCRSVIDRISATTTPFTSAGEALKHRFSSEYISAQIDIMLKMQAENPTEAIGKSKEFIESCCKTILEEIGVAISKDWNVSQLVKVTMKSLDISTEDVSDVSDAGKTVKAVLGNLSGIAGNIAELRNAYGSGHGKSASYKGLTVRHAKLAVGSSITLVNYLCDTFEWRRDSCEQKRVDIEP